MLKVEYVNVTDIRPCEQNPRKNDDNVPAVGKSMEAFGWTNPILVRKANGMIIAGHTRLKAAIERGLDKVPVIYLDLDETDAKAYMLADNKLTENAEWDGLKLAEIFAELDQLNVDLDLTGFSPEEIEDYVLGPMGEPQGDEDAIPEVPEEPTTKVGDLWILGSHRLLCGDSTKAEDVERLMGGEKADMVFTDPPYNVASESKNYAQDVSKAMRDISNAEWDKNFDPRKTCEVISKNTKDNSTVYIFTSHFLFSEILSCCAEWADFTSYCVWAKPNPMPSLSKRHWTWNTELCIYATKGSKRVVNFPDEGHALSCWTTTKKSDGTHPTQKPVELCENPITFNTKTKGLVFDLFLGSGTTLIACEKLGRKCFGMEIDAHYCDVIIRRYEDYTGGKAVLEKQSEDNK